MWLPKLFTVHIIIISFYIIFILFTIYDIAVLNCTSSFFFNFPGNDLFLDKTVHCYLAAFLREYTKPVYLDKMNFDENIPGILSFYDLYVNFSII